MTGEKKLLLVDDDPDVRKVLSIFLENAGFAVHVESSGAAALSFVRDRRYPIDVLITDVQMPDLSGIELARAARREQPALPILLISGGPVPTPLEQGWSLIVKPVAQGVLIRSVYRLLRGVPFQETRQ